MRHGMATIFIKSWRFNKRSLERIQNMNARFNKEAGIAIGPILFVVAILASLATAIAAGSSTFATNASQETNRTNAAAMISIGQNLKMGVDRIVRSEEHTSELQ